jgi:hypothetical protein
MRIQRSVAQFMLQRNKIVLGALRSLEWVFAALSALTGRGEWGEARLRPAL